METLKYTKNILRKNELFAKKRYGQNFLIDDYSLENIVEGSDINEEHNVFEIGPGLGNLTKYILDTGCKVTAFEIDEDMINILKQRFENNNKLDIVKKDILEVDLNDYIKDGKVKVVANIPYYITSPIIFKLLQYKEKIESITLMVQKEVAARLCANENSKDYGALTINVRALCDVKRLFEVNKECFLPSPKVDSSVVFLKPNNKYNIKDISKFEKMVKSAFSARRKTLLNSLDNSHINNMSKEEINNFLKLNNIDGAKRPENITIEEYVKMANAI